MPSMLEVVDFTNAIETEDLWRVYKIGNDIEVPALRGLNIQIEPGHFVALKGRSGSGKTTLLNCLSGLDRPTTGVARVLGHDLSQLNDRQLTQWRREQLGFVFQSFGLLPTLSAYENVELPLRIQGLGHAERRKRTLRALAVVGLRRWADHRPYEMSGGQQQRVVIARALVTRPRLILADEPTGELDSETGRRIFALLQRIVEREHVTLVMATHDPLVLEYAALIYELEDGRLGN